MSRLARRILTQIAAGFCLAAAVAGSGAGAQELLGRYTAVIGPEDRRNSSGAPLLRPGQILAQDRANVHRFGVMQPGDQSDPVFSQRDMRAAMPDFLARGGLDAAASAALSGPGQGIVTVDILGAGGRPYAVRVSGGGGMAAPVAAPSGVPALGRWQFAPDASSWRGAAEVGVPGGRVALECTRVGADPAAWPGPGALRPPTPGTFTLVVSQPSVIPPVGGAAMVTALVDGAVRGAVAMVHRQNGGAMEGTVPAAGPLVAGIGAGSRLTLSRPGAAPLSIGLSGSSAAIGALSAFCATPLDPSLMVAAATAPATPPTSSGPAAAQPGSGGLAPLPMRGAQPGTQPSAGRFTPLPSATGGTTVAQAQGRLAPLPGLQAGPAASAQPAPQGLTGEETVSKALGLWLIGQRPGLGRDQRVQNALSNDELPPGYPVFQPIPQPDRKSLVGDYQRYQQYRQAEQAARFAHFDAVAAHAATQAAPQVITLEIGANLRRTEPGTPVRLDLGSGGRYMPNRGLEASVPAALRTLHVQLGYNLGMALMREGAPLALPLPEAIRTIEPPTGPNGTPGYDPFPNEDVFLRATMTISDQRVLLPVDAQSPMSGSRPSAEFAAQVTQVHLFRKPRTRADAPPAPEVLLASWQRSDQPAVAQTGLNTLETFAATYAAGLEEGRLLNTSSAYREQTGQPRTLASTGQDLNEASRTADLLIRAAAVLKASPERGFAESALLTLLDQVVDPLSRDGMVPPGFGVSDGTLNEIARARALQEAGPKLRDYILARAPEMPLPVRSRGFGELGTYDLESELFGLTIRPDPLVFLPTPRTRRHLDGLLSEVAEAVRVPVDAAEALLLRLDRDTLPGRTVPVMLDMQLAGARAIPQSSGPITMEDLQRVALDWRLERLAVHADLAGQEPLLTYAFKQPEEEGERVPDAVYATTEETILGAWAAARGGPDVLAQGIASSSDFVRRFGQLPQSAREQRARAEAERVIAAASDDFWIGFSLQLGEYDAEAQRVAVGDVSIFPLPSRMGERVDDVPGLHLVRSEAFDHLSVTPEQYETIAATDGGRHALMFGHVRVADEQDGGHSTLGITRPDEVLVLRETQAGYKVALRLEMEAAPRMAASGGTIAPPEVLRLDGEGLDLLALSLQPDLYGPPAFRRMLVERIARERADSAAGRTPAWGVFFTDVDVRLSPALIEELLSPFTEWSLARAQALPDRMLLPLGVTNRHPATGCREVYRLPSGYVAERAVVAQLPQLLPSVEIGESVSPVSNVTRPGGPVVHAVVGRPGHADGASGASRCEHVELRGTSSDLSTGVTGLNHGEAGYVDALVQADVPLVARGAPGGPVAIDYEIAALDVRLVPVRAAEGDQPGLRGVVVIAAEVTRIATWETDKRTRRPAPAATYEAEVWTSLLPPDEAPEHDILGLRLGASLADVEAVAAERMTDPIRHTSPPVATRGLYDHATGFATPDASEVILSIHDPGSEDSAAVALMRYRRLPPGAASVEAVRKLLTDKYGPDFQEQGNEMYWGIPPQEIDSRQVCGGHKTFRGNGALRMEPELTRDEIIARSGEGAYRAPEWGYYGWPAPFSEFPDYALEMARVYCGPVVLARVRADVLEPGSVDLTVWLIDKPDAERRASEAEASAPAPTLDMDL
ncbi:hypothetical protein [Tranquillimonas rosea]|uniref:hypothetical protein n=1 Tax=Tranquillimonas rosea TaxID=641238 RepID=UPI003BAC5027